MSNENQVLVTALVDIEHDREKHIPGTKSATFLMPESSVEALIKAGAIERARVVDADALTAAIAAADADVGTTTVTMADVAEHIDQIANLEAQVTQLTGERNDLLAQLGEAQAMRDGLADEVQALQAQLADAQAKLAGSVPPAVDAPVDAGADAGAASDAPADAADVEAPADAAPAATRTTTARTRK